MRTNNGAPYGVDTANGRRRMATYYRLRRIAWQTRAVELGIRPSVRAVAEAAGIPKSTLYRATKGHPPNAATTQALLDTLQTSFDTLFERVDGGES